MRSIVLGCILVYQNWSIEAHLFTVTWLPFCYDQRVLAVKTE